MSIYAEKFDIKQISEIIKKKVIIKQEVESKIHVKLIHTNTLFHTHFYTQHVTDIPNNKLKVHF